MTTDQLSGQLFATLAMFFFFFDKRFFKNFLIKKQTKRLLLRFFRRTFFWYFWTFVKSLELLWNFWIFFGIFLGFFVGWFWTLDFLEFFGFFKNLFRYFSKLIRLLLKVTKVTTEQQKWPKMGRNSIISSFFCLKAKKSLGQRPKPSAEARSRPAWQAVSFSPAVKGTSL